MAFLRKAGAFTSQVKRAALEKAGKVEATQESEEFKCKLESLAQTNCAFKNLQRVGTSIFRDKKQEGIVNPADEFMVTIKEVLTNEKTYKKARLAFDAAKDREHHAREAAKQPGKNQAKKEQNLKNAEAELETKQQEYNTAREVLEDAIDGLEKERDNHFEKSIQSMCDILSKLEPDWQSSDGPNLGGGGGSTEVKTSVPAPSTETTTTFSAPPPTGGEFSEPGEFAPPTSTEVTKPATDDSESD